LHTALKAFEPWKGEIGSKTNGALISLETGTAIPLCHFQTAGSGTFFHPSERRWYMGQVIGENNRAGDLVINVNKTKKLSNMRASGSDEKVMIIPAIRFSLEEYMEYIRDDEYLEVTPRSLRLRKIILDETERKRSAK
jgi:GTP-binding protein